MRIEDIAACVVMAAFSALAMPLHWYGNARIVYRLDVRKVDDDGAAVRPGAAPCREPFMPRRRAPVRCA